MPPRFLGPEGRPASGGGFNVVDDADGLRAQRTSGRWSLRPGCRTRRRAPGPCSSPRGSGCSGFLGMATSLCKVTIFTALGWSGMKTAPKYWSAAPAQLNGPGSVAPLLTFLASRRVTLSPNWVSMRAAAKDAGTVWSPNPAAGQDRNAATPCPFCVTWLWALTT